MPPSYKIVPKQMKNFIKELFVQLKDRKSPYEVASFARARYTQIHPHYDCNGKGARFLFYDSDLFWAAPVSFSLRGRVFSCC